MKNIEITNQEIDSLRMVIDYMEDSEQSHYQDEIASSEDFGFNGQHIYEHVLNLRPILSKAEAEADFLTLIENAPNYKVVKNPEGVGSDIYAGKLAARCFKGHDFYKFLQEKGIDWKSKISTRWEVTET